MILGFFFVIGKSETETCQENGLLYLGGFNHFLSVGKQASLSALCSVNQRLREEAWPEHEAVEALFNL